LFGSIEKHLITAHLLASLYASVKSRSALNVHGSVQFNPVHVGFLLNVSVPFSTPPTNTLPVNSGHGWAFIANSMPNSIWHAPWGVLSGNVSSLKSIADVTALSPDPASVSACAFPHLFGAIEKHLTTGHGGGGGSARAT
jgi:hypothetical protein